MKSIRRNVDQVFKMGLVFNSSNPSSKKWNPMLDHQGFSKNCFEYYKCTEINGITTDIALYTMPRRATPKPRMVSHCNIVVFMSCCIFFSSSRSLGPLQVKLRVCASTGNVGNVSPATDFKGNRKLATLACITARAWRTWPNACRDR